MAKLPCSFTMEQIPIVFIQLYRLKSQEKDHEGRIGGAFILQVPGPLSNVKWKCLRSGIVGEV